MTEYGIFRSSWSRYQLDTFYILPVTDMIRRMHTCGRPSMADAYYSTYSFFFIFYSYSKPVLCVCVGGGGGGVL